MVKLKLNNKEYIGEYIGNSVLLNRLTYDDVLFFREWEQLQVSNITGGIVKKSDFVRDIAYTTVVEYGILKNCFPTLNVNLDKATIRFDVKEIKIVKLKDKKMDTVFAKKLGDILSGCNVSNDEFNEIIDLMDQYKNDTIEEVQPETTLEIYDVWESLNGNLWIKVSDDYSLAFGAKGSHEPSDHELALKGTPYRKKSKFDNPKKVGRIVFDDDLK